MLKIKKNDRVKVIKGKDSGKSGKVLRIDNNTGMIYVEGMNIIHRHTRQRDQNKPGGIIKKEGPVNISDVMLICPNCGKAVRVGFEIKSSGEKSRICKKCNQQI
ncbi:MAG: 50S ribosomal protein L24 [Actinobacteria bacterium]|nr:50S ribosomal protein L24 [Actinomycetota bacterium]